MKVIICALVALIIVVSIVFWKLNVEDALQKAMIAY